jgi:hypothetical protein
MIAVGAVLIGIVLYAVEITYFFGRYLQLNSLLAIGAGVGLVLGIGIALRYRRRWTDSYDQMRLLIGLGIAGLLFGPLLLSGSNRLLDFRPPRSENAVFISTEGRVKSRFGVTGPAPEPDSYATIVLIEGQLLRFDTKAPLFTDATNGDPVTLLIQPGFWRLRYVVVESE